MNNSTTRDTRKREVEQSPSKKKFKDSSISKEDLDAAIANGIRLALQEQQNILDSIVASAVKESVDSILVPALRDLRTDLQKTNEAVKDIGGELDRVAASAKSTKDRVDSVQAAAREDRRTVIELKKQLDQLTTKLTALEDRGRRNNVRIVGLPESSEGSDTVGYLKANLPKWIPSLKGRDIDIERAHRVYDGRDANANKPRTLIFRLLRWQDRSAILAGARKVYPVKFTNGATLLFFPDFSPVTTAKRKSFSPVMKKATAMGLEPFLIYPALMKMDHGGKKMTFDCPQAAEDFVNSLPRSLNPASATSGDTVRFPGKDQCQGIHGGAGNLVDMND
ncbi:hypothetical protein ACEWY4_013910 [Coilia grayii]|uniref:LINE-1 type transposase domain-containing 1 n=1 Tax=Coilia grayii TaxID=363190 RepID=A0ABD1JXQ3_9TELE